MFCLVISIAHPSYKRPSIETSVYFFETEQEVMCKLKDCKINFIADFDTSEDPIIETLTKDSPDELIDELFKEVSDIDNFYRNSYMDNPPFFWEITKVEPGTSIHF
jgi:hypothetical protein